MLKREDTITYVGLTDDPEGRKREHGNPNDLRVVHTFRTEQETRNWEEEMLDKGYKGDVGGKGWKYAYTYSL